MKIPVALLLVALSSAHGYVQQLSGGSGGYVQPPSGSGGHVHPPIGSGGHVHPPSGSGGHVRPPIGGGVPNTNCFEMVLKTDLKNLVFALQGLICSYENCKSRKEKGNDCSLEEWTSLFKKLKQTMKDTGCMVDQLLLGGKPTVEEITLKIGEALEQLRDPIRDLLVQLGVEEPLFDALCKVLGELLLKLGDLVENVTAELKLVGITDTFSGLAGGILGGGLLGGLGK